MKESEYFLHNLTVNLNYSILIIYDINKHGNNFNLNNKSELKNIKKDEVHLRQKKDLKINLQNHCSKVHFLHEPKLGMKHPMIRQNERSE